MTEEGLYVCCANDLPGFRCSGCGYSFHYACDFATEEEVRLFQSYFCINCKFTKKRVNIVKPEVNDYTKGFSSLHSQYKDAIRTRDRELEDLRTQLEHERSESGRMREQYSTLERVFQNLEERHAQATERLQEASSAARQTEIAHERNYREFETKLATFYDDVITKAVQKHFEGVDRERDEIREEKARVLEEEIPEDTLLRNVSVNLTSDREPKRIWKY